MKRGVKMNRAIALIMNAKKNVAGGYFLVAVFSTILLTVFVDWIFNSFSVPTGLAIILSAICIPLILLGIRDAKYHNNRIDRVIRTLQNDREKGYQSLDLFCSSLRRDLAKSISRLNYNLLVPETSAMAARKVKRTQKLLTYLESARDILTEEMNNKPY